MSSYVYFVYDPHKKGDPLKIGKAKDPFGRVKDLSGGADSLGPWEIQGLLECNSDSEAYECERILHQYFENRRHSKEWFNINIEDIKKYCLVEWSNKKLITDKDELDDLAISISPRHTKVELTHPTEEDKKINYQAIDTLFEITEKYQTTMTSSQWALIIRFLTLWKQYRDGEISYEKLWSLSSSTKLSEAIGIGVTTVKHSKAELLKSGFIRSFNPSVHVKIFCVTSKLLTGEDEKEDEAQDREKPNFKKEYLPKNYEERLRSLIGNYIYKGVDNHLLADLSPSDNTLLMIIMRSQAYEISLRKTKKSFSGLSHRQMMSLSNMSRQTIITSIKRLSNRGLINQYVLEENRTGFYVIAERLLNI